MDTVSDAIRLEVAQHLVDAVPVLVLSRVAGNAESSLARLLEPGDVIAVAKVWVFPACDVDPDHTAVPIGDGLLDEDRVQAQIKCPVEAEDQPSPHRVLQQRAVKTPTRRHDDVVEIALPAPVSLHRVVAKL